MNTSSKITEAQLEQARNSANKKPEWVDRFEEGVISIFRQWTIIIL